MLESRLAARRRVGKAFANWSAQRTELGSELTQGFQLTPKEKRRGSHTFQREIGHIYTLLRNANDNLLETSLADNGSTEDGDSAFPRTARWNKLLASNLRQNFRAS